MDFEQGREPVLWRVFVNAQDHSMRAEGRRSLSARPGVEEDEVSLTPLKRVRRAPLIGPLLTLFPLVAKRHKARVFAVLGLSVVASVSDVVSLGLMIPLLGSVLGDIQLPMIAGTPFETFAQGFKSYAGEQAIRMVLVSFFAVLVVKETALFFANYLSVSLKSIFERDFRDLTFSRIVELPYSVFQRGSRSEFFSTTTNFSAKAGNNCSVLVALVPSILLLSVNFVILAALSSVIQVLVGIFVFALLLAMNSVLMQRQISLSLESRRLATAVNEHAHQFLSSIKYIQQSGLKSNVAQTYERTSLSFNRNAIRRAFYGCLASSSQKIAGIFVVFGILVAATYFERMSPTDWAGYVAVYLLTLSRVAGPSIAINQLRITMASNAAAVDAVADLLNEVPETQDEDEQEADDLQGGNLVFEGVSFSYGDSERPAVDDVSMEFREGRLTAVVGESGAGKSTILDLICGLYDPGAGEILFARQPLSQLGRRAWRRRLSIVPQRPVLFRDTIENNIRFANPAASPEEVREAVSTACLDDLIAALPAGLDTVIGDDGDAVSGGQAQRIAIARALVRNPSVLILDEATSAQDSVTEERIREALEGIRGQLTTIVVAHRLSTIIDADRIYLLHDGRVVDYGTHTELLASSVRYRTLVRRQDLG